MTPNSASNTLTPTLRFSELEKSAPQIQEAACVTTAPWLFSAVAQVREIEASGELVSGIGDFRIGTEAAKRARQLLSSIQASYLPVPLVAPVPGGGLSITWSVGDKEVKLALEPGGAAYCFKFESDEMLDDPNEEITGSAPLADQLRWMTSRRS